VTGPDPGAALRESQLVGRDGELEVIAAMLSDAATSGEGQLFVGDPGVGKTALLDVAAAEAAKAGYQVIRVAGAEFEADIGYSALNQAVLPLEHLIPRLDDLHRDALCIALGTCTGEPPDRLVVATAALRLLQLAGQASAVLLAIDDLHWVDRASAEVFLFVARRVRGWPVAFLATALTDTGDLPGYGSLEEHELFPLDGAAADALLRARSPALAPGVQHRLLQEAQGNPLALLELPTALSGEARASGDPLHETLPLTRRLQALFASRITGMPAGTRDLLLLASLEGTGDWQILRDATGDPELSHLGAAEAAGVVAPSSPDERLTFRHPLIRSAVVALASPPELRDAHRRLAAALGEDPDRHAWHLAQAAVLPDAHIADLLEQAARRAVARGDRGAGTWYFRAADLSPDPRERFRRRTEAAWFGAFRSVDESLSKLLTSLQTLEPGSDEALYTTAVAVYFMLNGDGDVRTAFGLVRDALDAVHPEGRLDTTAVKAVVDLSAYTCMMAGRSDCSAEHHRILERLARIVPERAFLFAASLLDPARDALGNLDRIDQALSVLDRTDDVEDIISMASTAIYVDRLAFTNAALERVLACDPGQVAANYTIGARVPLCFAQFTAGDWDAVRRTSRAARKVCRDEGLLLWEPHVDYIDGMVAAVTGDHEGVTRVVERLREAAEVHNARLWQMNAHYVLALAAAGEGEFETVFYHANAISSAGTFAEQTPTALRVFHELVDAAVHTDRASEARRHVGAAQDLHISQISPRLGMLVGGAEALVTSDPNTANDLFEHALAIDGIGEFPFDVARVRLSYGEHLRLARAGREASWQLESARATFARLGATPWVARIDAELDKLAGHVPEGAGEKAGLTSKEYEVAQLAARGLTNKEIATELFLSPRTVGTYLYRAFPKLGVGTRAALRDALTGRDDDPAPPPPASR
jgi:DNA-binding CsgD family transcriptional regulator